MTDEPTFLEFPLVFEDARLAWLAGRDEHAENLLMSVRHRATVEKDNRNAVRSEIMLALFTLATDDETRSMETTGPKASRRSCWSSRRPAPA